MGMRMSLIFVTFWLKSVQKFYFKLLFHGWSWTEIFVSLRMNVALNDVNQE
jgi:hypothetical protein